jgi:predicted Zn-dependent protease with MMP-like domain
MGHVVPMKYTVYFTQTASAEVKVEAGDYNDAIERAWEDLPSSLCHHCASQVDLLGDWEPDAVVNESGKTVWQERT